MDIFDKYGLDYCCHGNTRLADACSIKFINSSKVSHDLKEIDKGDSLQHIAEREITFLIDYIINTHHTYVKEVTPSIVKQFADCVNIYGVQYPTLIKAEKIFLKIASDRQTSFHAIDSLLE